MFLQKRLDRQNPRVSVHIWVCGENESVTFNYLNENGIENGFQYTQSIGAIYFK
jgi:hypothetical protein